MSFYDRMAKTANKLLVGKGQQVTITHVVQGTYDPATGLVTNSTTTQKGNGAIMDWNSNQIDSALIFSTDKKLLLSPLNTSGSNLTPPVLGDKITDAAGVVYNLVEPLKTLAPAGGVVMFECNLRK